MTMMRIDAEGRDFCAVTYGESREQAVSKCIDKLVPINSNETGWDTIEAFLSDRVCRPGYPPIPRRWHYPSAVEAVKDHQDGRITLSELKAAIAAIPEADE